jgi:hypothetical protein
MVSLCFSINFSYINSSTGQKQKNSKTDSVAAARLPSPRIIHRREKKASAPNSLSSSPRRASTSSLLPPVSRGRETGIPPHIPRARAMQVTSDLWVGSSSRPPAGSRAAGIRRHAGEQEFSSGTLSSFCQILNLLDVVRSKVEVVRTKQ